MFLLANFLHRILGESNTEALLEKKLKEQLLDSTDGDSVLQIRNKVYVATLIPL